MRQQTLTSCRAFVSAQLGPLHKQRKTRPPVVTLSREVGAGGLTIAQAVCARLQAHAPPGEAPWTAFDKNLVEHILEDHDLPGQLAEFMREEADPPVSEFLEEVLGVRPPAWQLFEQTSNTVLKLATMGRCVLVGRGANIITAGMPNAVHVRLVASVDERVRRMMARDGLDFAAARDLVQRTDRARQRYLRKHFDRDVADPGLYHAVINTERVPPHAAAELIAALVRALHPQA
ncbi:MAG: cytidylate kinase-like family protein [Myxococcales bacterium]|nr:cytidylate kinase-like family protein [Myxococcales bacterium]MCB9523674.1 cytidylate kinase-like family protein [Myxococcales bacterium]